MTKRDRLTNKQFQLLLIKHPAKSIRFRDIGGMRVEMFSLIPGKRGGVAFTSLGYIQLPKDSKS